MNDRNNQIMDQARPRHHMEEEKRGKGLGIKHGMLMILCCLLPIMLIGILPLLGLENISWTWALFLLCPLMHIGMMFFMKDHH